jgi:hypothetical protein
MNYLDLLIIAYVFSSVKPGNQRYRNNLDIVAILFSLSLKRGKMVQN